LLDYSWPGNVRELQNAWSTRGAGAAKLDWRERAPAEVQLPTVLQQAERGAPRQGVQSLDDVERHTILQALAQCHGNKKKAAELSAFSDQLSIIN